MSDPRPGDPPGKPPEPGGSPDDVELLARIGRGDPGAFEVLYARHAATVMRFLHHLCQDAGLAEDLTQETFVKAWRAAGRFEPRASVRTWLLEIAKRGGWNAAAKRSRRRPVWGSRLPTDPDASPRALAPFEAASRAEEVARIRGALLGLPPKLRLVFVLVRLEGLPYPEAAAIAGIPVGTAKSRMSAAEAWLRQHLAGPGAPA